jgi:hypothetical protein
VTFSIEIDDRDLARGLLELTHEIDVQTRAAMERASDILTSEARSLAPKVTGELAASLHPIATTGTVSNSTVEGGVESSSAHGLPVHDGAKPHRIYPRRAGVLAWPRGNPTHFARFVDHPGNRPNPFAELALELRAPDIEAEFANGYDLAFERTGFGR